MTTKYANLITSNHDIKTNPYIAGWSSPVARQAHNLKVVGSNPTPATKYARNSMSCGLFDSETQHLTITVEALWKQEGAKFCAVAFIIARNGKA